MTKEWTWQAEREALVKRVRELEGLADFWHDRSHSAHARIAELEAENARQHEALLCARALIDTPIARRKLKLDPHDERIMIIRTALEGEK